MKQLTKEKEQAIKEWLKKQLTKKPAFSLDDPRYWENGCERADFHIQQECHRMPFHVFLKHCLLALREL